MTKQIKTATDGRQYVITALDGRETEFDVDAIVDACHDVAGSWDFDAIDTRIFWVLVSACDLGGA